MDDIENKNDMFQCETHFSLILVLFPVSQFSTSICRCLFFILPAPLQIQKVNGSVDCAQVVYLLISFTKIAVDILILIFYYFSVTPQ